MIRALGVALGLLPTPTDLFRAKRGKYEGQCRVFNAIGH